MRIPRPIDSTLHGVVDYAVGTTLLTAFPRLAGIAGTPAARHVRTAGAFHLGYSALTRYRLGLRGVIPFRAHLALDAAGALALAAAPFVTGRYRDGRDQWLPQVALALFELQSLALTDPSEPDELGFDDDAAAGNGRVQRDSAEAVTPSAA